jgi:glycosyltransferase involved in cell wall biosynthesis
MHTTLTGSMILTPSKLCTPKISVILIGFNMARELPRTIRSLSPQMQRGIDPADYEVILIDNGSTKPFDEAGLRRWIPDLVVHRMEKATVSPVPAINLGIGMARADFVGVCIDGARMASPGLLAAALAASRLHARPIVGTISFHLGPDVQMRSVQNGYDQVTEDALLSSIAWEKDGYRLFEISALAGSSERGWFEVPAESNAVFLKAEHWRDLGGYDPGFVMPGGGLANLDLWARACADENAELIMLLGEATFHQMHGGVATNSPASKWDLLFAQEYIRLRGGPYQRPIRQPMFFGSFPESVRKATTTPSAPPDR